MPIRPPDTQAVLDRPFSPAVWLGRLFPGLLLCGVVTLAAMALERGEAALLGRNWVESLVLAILVGTAVRTAWTPGARFQPGVKFSAKMLLEVAVVLLGASISTRTVMAAGGGLLVGIAAIVTLAIVASYALGRLLGLQHRMAMLVACGNSICGNSAIAAVAPVIGATGDDIAASIGFTAVLGVAVVLGLPLLAPVLSLSNLQFGVLAGLTVYAVPQVLAATAPVGAVAVQMGTLVKLVRVLMLGPVVLVLTLLTRRDTGTAGGSLKLHKLITWFIIGFLALAAVRSADLIPPVTLSPIALMANILTIVAMAALGLGTDLKVLARAGGRVTAVVTLSLVLLAALSLGLIRLLAVA